MTESTQLAQSDRAMVAVEPLRSACPIDVQVKSFLTVPEARELARQINEACDGVVETALNEAHGQARS